MKAPTALNKKLTIHVLDVAQGESAARLAVTVQRLVQGQWQDCAKAETARNGRTATPLLSEADFPAGAYRLCFAVGDYFAAQGVALPTPRFIDHVTIDIGVGDDSVHLPLLITPFSYSLYRGS